jgi:DNA helicase-2/ATP-dependent DNA helicase PcrA
MTLLLVGDQDQTLFRFQGARPELLTNDIDNWLPHIETIKLEINYRSQNEIIAKSQQLISHNYSGLGGPYPQEFIKDATGIKGQGEPVQFQMYETAEHEAIEIANNINELIQSGYKPGDFFIGARTRAQLGYLEGALVRANVPFINITGGSFWQSRHVAGMVAYLRLAYSTCDRIALERVYNIASANHKYGWKDKKGKFEIGDYCSFRGLGIEFLRKISYNFNNIDKVLFSKEGWRYQTKKKLYSEIGPTKAQDLQEFVWMLGQVVNEADNAGQVIQVIMDDCYEKYLRNQGMGDDGLSDAKLEDLATVQEIASRYASIDKFLLYVDKMVQAAEDTKNKDWGDYVVISTIHQLKGLERKVVFGIGWCEGTCTKSGRDVGLLPHTFSLSPPPDFGVLPAGGMSPMEDERCIGFVLVSRAIERVYLSGIKSYRTYSMAPSRFIYEMELADEKV